jgi:hypothetical protein
MPFAIPPSLPSNGINPRDSYRGPESRLRERDTVRETDSFRAGRSRPEPRRGVRESDRASFRGTQIEYRSEESASLEVKTDDGDTVSISFAALNRIRAGAYSAQAEGSSASAQSVSAESAFNVQVNVKGSLDDEELSQLSELLQRLVSTARSGEPKPIQTSGLESLDSFQFAYNAYQQASRATLEARAR